MADYNVKEFLKNVSLHNISEEDLDTCYNTLLKKNFHLFDNPERFAFCLKGYYEHYEEYEKCANLQKLLDNGIYKEETNEDF